MYHRFSKRKEEERRKEEKRRGEKRRAQDAMGASQSGYSYVALTQWLLEGSKRFGRVGFEKSALSFTPLPENLSNLNFVVTGANSGLGKCTAMYLASRKATVHILCRNKERGELARNEMLSGCGGAGNVILHLVDLASVKEVRKWAESWESSNPTLHGLICNAGFIPQSHSLTSEGLEPSWATALTQSYLLVDLLTPSLLRASESSSGGFTTRSPPARVVIVSSAGGFNVRCDVQDLNGERRKFDGALQYCHTKRAQMLLAEVWGGKLPQDKVHVSSMHPGWSDTEGVRTQLPDFHEKRKGELRSVSQGADTIIWLATSPSLPPHSAGCLFFDRAVTKADYPLAGTRSTPEEIAQLWQVCKDACGR